MGEICREMTLTTESSLPLETDLCGRNLACFAARSRAFHHLFDAAVRPGVWCQNER
jgi:hypothetical protein